MTAYVSSNTFFEIQDGGHVLCMVSKFQAFPSRLEFENVSNRSETVLVTLIASNTRNLRKILKF